MMNLGASGAAIPIFGVIAVAALYFGREIFIPIALAVLLSFLLAPAVRLLRRIHIPRGVAVLAVTTVAFTSIIALGALIVVQLADIAGELPRYQVTLREKIHGLRGGLLGGGFALDRISEVLQDLRKEAEQPSAAPSDRPLSVEVREPTPGPLQTLALFVKPLVSPAVTAGIVFVFVAFILLQFPDLRNRLVKLVGARDIQRTTAALDDAGSRLSRLFLSQLALNAFFGAVVGVGLWIIGVPSPALWGVLAMVCRFVPYVGALIAAIFPIALAIAVGSGWSMALWTAGLFLAAEPIVGQLIEPLVYSHSAGLSPLAVVAAATFWTWLWGPVGLLLSTPLTLCLVVLGRHVDRFEFFEVMFGDQPPLTPQELVYQRLLASDPIEISEEARKYLKDKSPMSYFDEILMESLRLANADAERGLLDEERIMRVRDGIAEVVDDVAAYKDKAKVPVKKGDKDSLESPLDVLDRHVEGPIECDLPSDWRGAKPILCLPALGVIDEAAAVMLVEALERRGVGAMAGAAGSLSMSKIFSWDTEDIKLICICYLENATPAQIRYAVRRVRRRAPHALILVSLLGHSSRLDERALDADTEIVRHSLQATVERILDMARGSSQAAVPPESTASSSMRIAAAS